MTKILDQAKAFETTLKDKAKLIENSVNVELNRLNKNMKSKLLQSQNTTEVAIQEHQKKLLSLLETHQNEYSKALKSAQSRAILLITTGLIIGISATATVVALGWKYQIIQLITG